MPQGQKNQNIKQKQYCNKVNKDFKNGPHLKILKRKKKDLAQLCSLEVLYKLAKHII